MKQMIDNREMVDKLNDLNHDYQRMRKLAKRRINGRLTKFNKARAKEERDLQSKLGGESWVNVERAWVRYGAWLVVGFVLGVWII
jgi:hypothetical protein